MLTLTVKSKRDGKNARVEVDADRFERLAGTLGLFNTKFLTSIARSEREIKSRKTQSLKSLKRLRHA